MGAGRPVLALAAGNEAARVVGETRIGWSVPPDYPALIADAIRRVLRGELADAYAPQGLEQYTYPGPAERIGEILEAAIARRATRGQQ